MTIKAIIWDLDGTLIHFKIDYMRARKEAIRILKKHGVPKELLTTQDSILDNVSKARAHFKVQSKSQEEIQKIVDEVDEKVIEVEYDAVFAKKNILNKQFIHLILLKILKYHYKRRK